MGNYLVDVQNLYFNIVGTLQPDQPNPTTTFGYPFVPDVVPNLNNRAHFVGIMSPATVINGVITNSAPPIPGTSPVQIYGQMGNFSSTLENLNGYYFGRINPNFTNGHTIGYLHLLDMRLNDYSHSLSSGGVYSPFPSNDLKNPRAGREAQSAVYSEIFKYYNAISPYNIDSLGNPRNHVKLLLWIFVRMVEEMSVLHKHLQNFWEQTEEIPIGT